MLVCPGRACYGLDSSLSVTLYRKGKCVKCLSHSVAVVLSIAVMVEGELSHFTTLGDRRKLAPTDKDWSTCGPSAVQIYNWTVSFSTLAWGLTLQTTRLPFWFNSSPPGNSQDSRVCYPRGSPSKASRKIWVLVFQEGAWKTTPLILV